MWLIKVSYVLCLLASPAFAGIKDLSSHFTEPDADPDPRGLSEAGVTDMEAIPLDFHKENTVTNDLPFDGFEDEDYLDFDMLLAEDTDDDK